MDIDKFKAGQWEQQYQYKSFLPELINLEWRATDPETLTIMDEASRLLGELNAFSQLIPDVDFFIQMHITKEATTSSRIEGTQTNMEDALIDEKHIDPEKRDDWQEVQNYIKAMHFAISQLDKLPLSNRLLRDAHKILLQGVRGKQKRPGEFRVSQNWIGISLKNSIFIPPHHEQIANLMSDLEKFMHNDQIHVPHLLKIAFLHYQFETIHPFLDGNGRLGRLLIVLYMVEFKLLNKPSLYLSDFFERHKGQYYDYLMAVRTTDNFAGWLRFFVSGVKETAERSIETFKAILILKEAIEREKIPHIHPRKQANAQQLMHSLYQTPVVTANQVSKKMNIRHNTATALINDFVKMDVLKEITGNKRNRLYYFEPYVKIFME